MKFGEKKSHNPYEISDRLASQLYDNNPKYLQDSSILNRICEVFSNRKIIHKEIAEAEFTCYIEKNAFDEFVEFANKIYRQKQHEATGLIVGYYLHDKNAPESRFIVGTKFLEANGSTSSLTCEMSYDDVLNQSNYYEEHKLMPLIWIHSHPGFGVFYSGTDDLTLRNIYFAPYQAGVVVDILREEVLGFKMYGDERLQENVYIFDLDKSTTNYLDLVYAKHIKNEKRIRFIKQNSDKTDDEVETDDGSNLTTNEQDSEDKSMSPGKIKQGFLSVSTTFLIMSLFCILTMVFVPIHINKMSKALDSRICSIERSLENNQQEILIMMNTLDSIRNDMFRLLTNSSNEVYNESLNK